MRRIVAFILSVVISVGCLCCVSGVGAAGNPNPGEEVSVTIPQFKIYVNGKKLDPRFLWYPFIFYKDTAYMPLTWANCDFAGLSTSWSKEKGFAVTQTAPNPNGKLDDTPFGSENPETMTATVATGNITINGKAINNRTEQYPILQFRDTYYLPLTQRFTADMFGWSCKYTEGRGLDVNTAGATGGTQAPSVSNVQSQSNGVEVTIPAFRIYINNKKALPPFLEYPYIVFNGITYFPMTYDGARFLGLTTSWNATDGLRISMSKIRSEGENEKTPAVTDMNQQAGKTYFATIAEGKITVNGKAIDNSKEQYPLLVFRNITYFPLTWRFAVEEFGWDYSYIEATGLKIKSIISNY